LTNPQGVLLRITTRNARYQELHALLTNRTKRQRLGEFLIHGVRPITLAVEQRWPISALLRPAGAKLSGWALGVIERLTRKPPRAQVIDMAPELFLELADRTEAPELLAVARIPSDDLSRIRVPSDGLTLVADRPANPGNLGTLIRSADAFGASGVIVTGHAADVYDPKAVRASTGSLFGLPVVRRGSPRDVLEWVATLRSAKPAVDLQVIGTDEAGDADVFDVDLTGPCLVVVGSEQRGMSATWRQACDRVVRIPIGGTASSLNMAVAASIVCYERERQRRRR
jgi:TrmH family RNA methyltransferase